MFLVESLLIFFAVVISYILIVIILHRKGVFKKYNISFYGPLLMWRTQKGITFLKKLAQKRRFWKAFGNTGVVVCFIAMFSMALLVLWNTWSILEFTPEQIQQLPGIEFAFVIPIVNPLFPLEYLGYIILALIIAMVVHEFSHGILTFVSKLSVKSLGILYLIFPLGAFCEPDEKQLQQTKTTNRMRIFAAGPTMNFVVVLLSIFLFSFVFMSAVQPAADGVGVLSAGEGTPAEKIGIKEGMIITSINNTNVTNVVEFFYVMQNTSTNQTVSISYVQGEKTYHKTITLADKYEEYEKRNYLNNESYRGVGYMGIGPSNLYRGYLSILQNPFTNTPDLPFPTGFGLFWVLPLYGYFQGFNPIAAPFIDSYVITGPLGFIPNDVFWVIVNALYWIFWLNFAIALFNVLPALPLDGGYLFKDALTSVVRRIKRDISEETREQIVKQISLTITLIILFLIFLPFLIKYLTPYFS